jgi:hypothetical protein
VCEQKHPLPDDEDLLVRLLDHPNGKVLRPVLEHLIDLQQRRTIHRPSPILSRLGTIENMTEDPRTTRLTRTLRAAIEQQED